MAALKPHHFRPVSEAVTEIRSSAAAGDNAMDGGTEPHYPVHSLFDSDIVGTPPSPSVSGFIIEPVRSVISGEDSGAKPRRSERSTSKRKSENGAQVKTSKKKKKKSSSLSAKVAGRGDKDMSTSGAIRRVWSEEDEIVILKGVIEFRAQTGSDPTVDAVAFLGFLKDSIHVDASKSQLMSKVRKLKRRFHGICEKFDKGEVPVFNNSHESTAFELSKKIWGITESNEEPMIDINGTNGRKQTNQAEETPDSVAPETIPAKPLSFGDASANKNEKVASLESENGNGRAKARCDFEDLADAAVAAAAAEANWNPLDFDNMMVEKECNGKENGGSSEAKSSPEVVDSRIEMADGKEDAKGVRYSYLLDALETIAAEGMVSDLQKSLLVEKIGDFEGGKGKEWNDQWKAFRMEEMQFEIKKLNLIAKFSEAVLDELNK